jgi:hypothetical protein
MRKHYYVREPGQAGAGSFDIVTADSSPLTVVVTLSNCTDEVAWAVEEAMNRQHRLARSAASPSVDRELQQLAVKAVADADPDGPGGRRLQAVKIVRDRDGKRHQLRDYIAAVDWALSRQAVTLTRAQKERAVAEMADRLAVAAVVCAERHRVVPDIRAARRVRRRHAALVRLAMARTVD